MQERYRAKHMYLLIVCFGFTFNKWMIMDAENEKMQV